MATTRRATAGKKKRMLHHERRHVPYNLRSHQAKLCEALDRSADDVGLQSLAVDLYSEGIIDGRTKRAVLRHPGYKGAAMLMDSVDLQVQRDPKLGESVLNIMSHQNCLRDIVQEIPSMPASSCSSDDQNDMENSSVSSYESRTHKTEEEVFEDAKILDSKFETLLDNLLSFLEHIAVDRIQLKLSLLINKEIELPKRIHDILDKVDEKTNHVGVIGYLVRHGLLGYLNHRLLDAFTNIINNEKWNTLLKDYETARNDFLKSTDLKTLAQVFHNHPSLAPKAPAGLPVFTVHLDSSWDNNDCYRWNELLEKLVNWPPFIYIKEITNNCIIIEYGVLPFFAHAVVRDLTDPKILSILEGQGVAKIDLSEQLRQDARSGVQHHEQEPVAIHSEQLREAHIKTAEENTDIWPFGGRQKVVSEEWHIQPLIEKDAQINKIWQTVSPSPSSPPTLEQFVAILSLEPEWYTLGILMGVPTTELDEIGQTFRASGIESCISELHSCLIKQGKPYGWDVIINTLKQMNNHQLADRIFQCLFPHHSLKPRPALPSDSKMPISHTPSTSDDCSPPDTDIAIGSKNEIDSLSQYQFLSTFSILKLKEVIRQLKESKKQKFLNFLKAERYAILHSKYDDSTFDIDNLLDDLTEDFSYYHFQMLSSLFFKFFQDDEDVVFNNELVSVIHQFNSSTKLSMIFDLNKPIIPNTSGTLVELNVRKFWYQLTLEQFNVLVKELFHGHFDQMSLVSINKSGTCYTWIIIPDIAADSTEFFKRSQLSFAALLRIIGVISLYIGDDVIYSREVDGCETIEAAMMQAIDLKNTRAVELLLAAGCNPQVASSNGDHDVFNILYIREKSEEMDDASRSLDGRDDDVNHMCVVDHNKYLQAVVDHSEPECRTCSDLKKMNTSLHQEIAKLRDTKDLKKMNTNLHQENAKLRETKDTISKLQQSNKELLAKMKLNSTLDDSTQQDSLSEDYKKKQTIVTSEKDQSTATEHTHSDEEGLEPSDIEEKYGYTPLHRAAENGKKETVELLLKEGAAKDINTKNWCGDTPLHFASQNGHDSIIEILIQYGATVDEEDEHRQTPLHKAAKRGKKTTVELLLKYKANYSIQSNYGNTMLHSAAYGGNTEIVELFLKLFDIHKVNNDFYTPLHCAAESGHMETVELLLKSGANIDGMKECYLTPLHVAAKKNRVDIAELLLKAGANVHSKEKYDGRTPLHHAAQEGYERIVELLLKYGANINEKDKDGFTPLHLAVGHREEAPRKLDSSPKGTVWILLSNGAKVNEQDYDDCTPLHYAAREADVRIVGLLLKHGANINEKDACGFTPLHMAVGATTKDDLRRLPADKFSPSETTVRMLLSNEAKVNEQDYYGCTPVHYADKQGHKEPIIQLLLDAGAVQPSELPKKVQQQSSEQKFIRKRSNISTQSSSEEEDEFMSLQPLQKRTNTAASSEAALTQDDGNTK